MKSPVVALFVLIIRVLIDHSYLETLARNILALKVLIQKGIRDRPVETYNLTLAVVKSNQSERR